MQVVNFGCRLNAQEGEAIRAGLAGPESARTVVVNTCAVTAEAEKQARQMIRRLRREQPDAHIVVTGCAAQINPLRYAEMPEVDRVLGNLEKLDIQRHLAEEMPRVQVADISSAPRHAHLPAMQQDFDTRPRAYLEVQQGCDHRCTFCIIPYGRGPSRSVPLGEIAAQAKQLAALGYREFVLTGVDLASYGTDLPGHPSLAQTARRLLALVPEIYRLRFSSLDPAGIDAAMIDLFASEARVMPHVHLSLQAGDDLILKRMKRRHTAAQARDIAASLRRARPGLALGADLIAGFPTEDDDAFSRGADLVREIGFAYLHVFPFSARTGTPAARMPQVPVTVRRQRAARLREIGQAGFSAHLAQRLGQRATVLVEKTGLGRDETYAEVILPTSLKKGSLAEVTISGLQGDKLMAETA